MVVNLFPLLEFVCFLLQPCTTITLENQSWVETFRKKLYYSSHWPFKTTKRPFLFVFPVPQMKSQAPHLEDTLVTFSHKRSLGSMIGCLVQFHSPDFNLHIETLSFLGAWEHLAGDPKAGGPWGPLPSYFPTLILFSCPLDISRPGWGHWEGGTTGGRVSEVTPTWQILKVILSGKCSGITQRVPPPHFCSP